MLKNPEVRAQLIAMGVEPVGSSAEDLSSTLIRNIQDWKRIARDSGAKFDG